MSTDYRHTRQAHRQSWFGLKRHAKHLLALRVPHAALRGITVLRPELRRGGRLPAPAHLKEVRGIALGHGFVMLNPDRCEIAKELYWGKGYRPRPEDAFAVDVFGRLARTADVMLDIGAYTGVFTLVATAVNPDLRAHAFEIVPDVYQALVANCVRNDVLDRVEAHEEGIGNPGDMMRVPARTGGSALPSFYSRKMPFDDGVMVPFVSLDSIGDLVPRRAKVVAKIDVEGTENDVLRKGQTFLRSFRPDVLCEILFGVADPAEIDGLIPAGYSRYLIGGSALHPYDRIQPDPRFRDWLLTCRSSEELASLGIKLAA